MTIVAALCLAGCQQDPHQREVSDALVRMMNALDNANWKAFWEEADPESKSQVLTLHQELHDALRLVDDLYERAEQPIARAALGRDLISDIPVGSDDAGPRLLARMFSSGAITMDERVRDGLTSTNATIDGDRAVIHTAAGEVFTFGRADGVWRSRLLIEMLDQSRPVSSLRESAKAVQTAKEAKHAAWVASRDPAQPQGAYNLVRFAMERTPVDASVGYALLDEAAKETLIEALKTSRAVQDQIQRRTIKVQRKGAYERYGITMHARAGSDRALYEAWAASKSFISPLPDASRPERVEMSEDGKRATVVTATNQRVELALGAEGSWRLTGATKQIDQALLAPVKASLAKLGGGG